MDSIGHSRCRWPPGSARGTPVDCGGPQLPVRVPGIHERTTKTPIICTVLYAANALTLNACNNLTTMPTINYNPSLVFWGDYLYIGYSASSGNCLSFYRGNADSIAAATASNINQVAGAWNPWTTNCAVQTNATPSLAVFQNGSLYIGYRANNNGKDFSVASVTTQGVATEEVMNYGMQGPASLLWVTYSAPDTTPAALPRELLYIRGRALLQLGGVRDFIDGIMGGGLVRRLLPSVTQASNLRQ